MSETKFVFFLFLISVPNEEPKGPVFKTFPQSATVAEGENTTFECETEKTPQKGESENHLISQ